MHFPQHASLRAGGLGLLALLLVARPAQGTIYLTQEQALALAFEEPAAVKRHALIFDDTHRQVIARKLAASVEQRGVLAYTGRLKSTGAPGTALFDAVIGKHEYIDYMAVIDRVGKVCFVEILAYRESYGGEIRDRGWRDQFAGKSEREPPAPDRNIVNISGATLSCRHVTEGVHKLLAVAGAYAEELGLDPEK